MVRGAGKATAPLPKIKTRINVKPCLSGFFLHGPQTC